MPLFRLTRNVLVQDECIDASAVDVVAWKGIEGDAAADTSNIGHVVNWFKAGAEGAAVQAMTARTMRLAASYSGDLLKPSLVPRLIGCVAHDEPGELAAGFFAAPPLERTVLDVGTFRVARPLPLLFDILESGARAADPSGFLVFTNSDICLMPHFYRAVQAMLMRGVDCLIINRRTVSSLESYGANPELAMTEVGNRHPGLDCFVFPAAWVAEFTRSDACAGAGWVMRSLLYNLVAKSKRMLILRDAHLTYHFGDDKPWADESLSDYDAFNLQQARTVLDRLAGDSGRRDVLAAFCAAHREPLQPGTLQ
ncbi:MAG: hypothetical protein V4787_00140 [Pseudomonadota bacterium]